MLDITLTGKRSDLSKPFGQLLSYFKNCYGEADVELQVPEFYYHCSPSTKVTLGLKVRSIFISAIALDSFNMTDVKVNVINIGMAMEFSKSYKANKFTARKLKNTPSNYNNVTSIGNVYMTSLSTHDDEDSRDLRDNETLEQYEERIYG